MIEDWIDKIKAWTLKDWTGLLMGFWMLTALVTIFDGFIDFAFTCLGVVTTAVMLKIIARIEKLEGEKKGGLPKPSFGD